MKVNPGHMTLDEIYRQMKFRESVKLLVEGPQWKNVKFLLFQRADQKYLALMLNNSNTDKDPDDYIGVMNPGDLSHWEYSVEQYLEAPDDVYWISRSGEMLSLLEYIDPDEDQENPDWNPGYIGFMKKVRKVLR